MCTVEQLLVFKKSMKDLSNLAYIFQMFIMELNDWIFLILVISVYKKTFFYGL